MAAAIGKIRVETVAVNGEFTIDPTLETVLNVEDNKDGTVTVLIVSYIRKGNGS